MKTVRRLAPAVAGLALLAGTVTGCEWPEGTRYVHQVFSEVDVTRGIVYRNTTTHTGQPVQLRLDIYRPRGDTATERPVVMWMFGGGWRFGDRDQLTAYATDSAKRGYVGVTIDYRLRPGEPFDVVAAAMDAYDDTIAAIQWLQAHAGQYGLDPDAVVAAGYSAGAVNALHAIYLPGSRGPATTPAAGAVALAGLTLTAPTAGRPPSIMFHGTNDTVVPFGAAQTQCDQSAAVGNMCLLVPYPGADHSIPFQLQADITARTADFIFEQVLWPLGYRPEQVRAAAA
jgi:acetyl esterase/lipase